MSETLLIAVELGGVGLTSKVVLRLAHNSVHVDVLFQFVAHGLIRLIVMLGEVCARNYRAVLVNVYINRGHILDRPG